MCGCRCAGFRSEMAPPLPPKSVQSIRRIGLRSGLRGAGVDLWAEECYLEGGRPMGERQARTDAMDAKDKRQEMNLHSSPWGA
jgi:hypothetical protein